MWVKMCGTTSLGDAEAAVEAGADALGFVFAPSPRQVSIAQAAAITHALPHQVEKYGVFVHPSFDFVVRSVQESGLTGVQLHVSSEPGLEQRLHLHFNSVPGFRLLRVIRLSPGEKLTVQRLEPLRAETCDRVLVDSRTTHSQGGTGVSFDWESARPAFDSVADLKLIVAGGLSPENVGEAVMALQPWGVDVVTGVEQSPGRKDPGKIKDFVQRAREAHASLAGR